MDPSALLCVLQTTVHGPCCPPVVSPVPQPNSYEPSQSQGLRQPPGSEQLYVILGSITPAKAI